MVSSTLSLTKNGNIKPLSSGQGKLFGHIFQKINKRQYICGFIAPKRPLRPKGQFSDDLIQCYRQIKTYKHLDILSRDKHRSANKTQTKKSPQSAGRF